MLLRGVVKRGIHLGELWNGIGDRLIKVFYIITMRVLRHPRLSSPSFIQKQQDLAQFEKNEFVPYVNERNKLGRLLPDVQSASKEPQRQRSLVVFRPYKKLTRQSLVNPKKRVTSPVVGQYFRPNCWLKPSAPPKAPDVPLSPPPPRRSRQVSVELPRHSVEYLRPKAKAALLSHSEYDILTAEVQVRLREQASISALRLAGTPGQIGRALRFEEMRGRQRDLVREIRSRLRAAKYAGLEFLLN